MAYLRIIGDVHGLYNEYIDLAKEAEYSIQLGDLGFDYQLVDKFLNPSFHRILGGNHDNYTEENGIFVMQPKHFLGDYGTYTVPKIGQFFYVRGGYSIDKAYRRENVDWWPAEQLSYTLALQALESYKKTRPRLMLTHECPSTILDVVAEKKMWDGALIRPSMTANLLASMLEVSQPSLWIFGHHHRYFDRMIGGTRFICLPELGYIDFEGSL